jgi:hypothetical protein
MGRCDVFGRLCGPCAPLVESCRMGRVAASPAMEKNHCFRPSTNYYPIFETKTDERPGSTP